MRQLLGLALVVCNAVTQASAQSSPAVVVSGLTNPESVVVDGQGNIFVSIIGERSRDGDGGVVKIDQGKAVPFASGLDDPNGLVTFQGRLFVADKARVWRIDGAGKAEVFAAASAFPTPPQYLNDLAVDVESGTLYVTDMGDRQRQGGGGLSDLTPRRGELGARQEKFPRTPLAEWSAARWSIAPSAG
jgi:glucose/arabinose dehydrogenase